MQEPQVALFIPCYNVASSVEDVLLDIPKKILKRLAKIYIIDNGSQDETINSVQSALNKMSHDHIEFFQNLKNVQLGGSTISAFDKALKDDIDYLICMHSDGQASPKDLIHFIKAIDSSKSYDFILGSRFSKYSRVESYSSLRLFFNKCFSYLQLTILKQPVFDIGAYICFNMSTIKKSKYKDLPRDMGYHPYLILTTCRFSSCKLNFAEFPIFWGKVHSTNINLYRYGLKHLMRILALWFGVYFRKPNNSPLIIEDKKLN